jgi:hypothetical protein
MSRYLFQFFGLLIAFQLLILWQRQNRTKQSPFRNGFHIVRWPLALRLIYAGFFTSTLAICGVLFWAELKTDEEVPSSLWVFAIALLALSSLGTLAWRTRTEYNESTVITYPMTGKPRQFALRDFTRAGPISWRGHPFFTVTGDTIYVNSFQTGAPPLIELLQRQVKETFE